MASVSCRRNKFWLTIEGDTEKGGAELWESIKGYGVNFTQLLDSAYIYGEAGQDDLREIIYQAAKLGKPIELC